MIEMPLTIAAVIIYMLVMEALAWAEGEDEE
jgi:hypothetical protein